MTEIIERLGKEVVLFIFFIMAVPLTIMSLISTCYLDKQEHPYYVFTSLLPVAFIFCILGGIVVFLSLRQKENFKPFKFKLSYLLAAAFILGCIFVVCLRFKPCADQRICLGIASDLHHGKYNEFKTTGYLQAYPQQAGLILFYYLLGFIIGPKNPLGLQFINVIAYVGFIYSIHRLCLALWKNERIANWTAVLTVLFLPLLFYTTFVYGTLLGLAASTFSAAKALEYMEDRKLSSALACLISIGFAVIFKKNFLVVAVALVLLLIVHSICKKHLRSLILIVLILFACTIPSKAAIASLEAISGYEIKAGIPSIAWATMGLQTGSRANGWYNTYNDSTYLKQNCNSALTKEIATKDFKDRIQYFKDHKDEAVSFFTQKTASQWSEPTFEAFFIIKLSQFAREGDSIKAKILKGFISTVLIPYLDFLQSFIYLGVIIYLIHDRKKLTLWELLPAIIFIGGFLFHTLWEAKSLYVVCYFVLLFPYCIKGYTYVCSSIKNSTLALKNKKANDNTRKILHLYNVAKPVIIVLLVGSFFHCICTLVPSAGQAVSASNEHFESFVSEGYKKKIEHDKDFYIKVPNQNLYLDTKPKKGKKKNTLYLNEHKKESAILNVEKDEKKGSMLRFKNSNLLISKLSIPTKNKDAFKQRLSFYGNTKKWMIERMEDDCFTIISPSGMALSRNSDGEVFLEPLNMLSQNQRWEIALDDNN